ARYLGDPDFVSMPIEGLLSYEYGIQMADSISDKQATPSQLLGKINAVQQGDNTTHLSVLDQDGNRVAATLSINTLFGSGYMPKGTGVLLNNEMDDFSAKPGVANVYGLVGNDANAIAPYKRPLSSMTPTFVEWDGKVAILGTPGGSRIITMVMLAVLDALEGKSPQQWVSEPRYHHQYLPDAVQAEPVYVGTEKARQLMLMGHKVESTGRPYGNMQAILWNQRSGSVEAASDPRRIGAVQAEPLYGGTERERRLRLMEHTGESPGRPYGTRQAIPWNQRSGSVEAASEPRGLGEALVRQEGSAPPGQ